MRGRCRRLWGSIWNNVVVSALLVFLSIPLVAVLTLLKVLPGEGERQTRSGWMRAWARGLAILGVIFVAEETISRIWPHVAHRSNLRTGLCIFCLVAAMTMEVIGRDMQSREPPPEGNRCRACGYDLTGNISGVCPECGKPIEASSPTEE